VTAERKDLMLPALDPATVPGRTGTIYPDPFRGRCADRLKQVVGDPLGLTQFGVNIVTLPPGSWSSQRHWHEAEDEFVCILEGHVTLVTDQGPQVMGPGSVAGFPAGRADGHHLINETDQPVRFLVVGSRADSERAFYPDIDLQYERDNGRNRFTDRTGKPY